MTALERSNLVLARILEKAMENGVSHWSLEFDDLGLNQEYATHFFPCVEWLEAEGLIRVGEYVRFLDGLANGSVENISLTYLGMSVLGTEIEVGGRKEPLSKTVTDVSEGRVDYHRIGDAIGGLIGGVIKSVGG